MSAVVSLLHCVTSHSAGNNGVNASSPRDTVVLVKGQLVSSGGERGERGAETEAEGIKMACPSREVGGHWESKITYGTMDEIYVTWNAYFMYTEGARTKRLSPSVYSCPRRLISGGWTMTPVSPLSRGR